METVKRHWQAVVILDGSLLSIWAAKPALGRAHYTSVFGYNWEFLAYAGRFGDRGRHHAAKYLGITR